MSVYFEKKVSLELIKLFLIYVFNIKEDEVKIFEQNYFFENGYLEVDDHKLTKLTTHAKPLF